MKTELNVDNYTKFNFDDSGKNTFYTVVEYRGP